MLGYVDEATKLPLPIQWTQTSSGPSPRAVLRIPADVAAHAAVVVPAFVFKIRGEPSECRRAVVKLD